MAAVDYFLKLEPVKGEAQDQKYKEHIDIVSWSSGFAQTGKSATGGGSGAGKVAVHDISISKFVDKSTPDLVLACCNGKHFKEAWIICRKAGEHPLEFLKIKLEQVLVSSVQDAGHKGEDHPMESLTLNFAKIQYEYKEQKPDGSAGTSAKKGWAINENVEHS